MDQTERWLTCEEISALWKMTSNKSVHRAIRSGELPAIKIGRRWRVRLQDFEAYEDSLTEKATA